jgi:putative membrane protein
VTDAPETQAERTDLSWQRTGLGLLAVAGLLGHRALAAGQPALLAAGGVAALLALGVLGWMAPVRYRQVRRRRSAGTGVAAPVLAAAVTAAVVLVALAAALAVVVVPLG